MSAVLDGASLPSVRGHSNDELNDIALNAAKAPLSNESRPHSSVHERGGLVQPKGYWKCSPSGPVAAPSTLASWRQERPSRDNGSEPVCVEGLGPSGKPNEQATIPHPKRAITPVILGARARLTCREQRTSSALALPWGMQPGVCQ